MSLHISSKVNALIAEALKVISMQPTIATRTCF